MKSKFVTQLKTLALAAGIVSMGTLAPVAQAAIVTQWDFSTLASFTSAVYETDGTDPDRSTTTSASVLSWGRAGADFTVDTGDFEENRSALTIGNGESGAARYNGSAATGTVNTVIGGTPTLADVGLGVTFTHFNNPISSAFDTLLRGSVLDTLTLTPLNPTRPDVSAPSIIFNFEFRETPNAGSGNPATCAGGELASIGAGCGDLFGFAGISNLDQKFSYDGQDYFASVLVLGPNFTASPIAFLNDGQCEALGFTTGTSGQRCQGFQTAEDAATTVRFGFVVTTRPAFDVPEPSTLALLGLALLGLGAARVRKSR